MPHVFVFYVREDESLVQRLVSALRHAGIKVWLDKNDIAPGMRWKKAIRNAIQNGDVFLSCFSKNYENRDRTYMSEELVTAIDELRLRPYDRSWFIPVILTDCKIPNRDIGGGETLSDIQRVTLYDDWETGIGRIISIVLSRMETSIATAQLQNAGCELIENIISHFDDSCWRVRDELKELVRFQQAAIPALIRTLGVQSSRIRANAAFALGKIGPNASNSTPFLMELLLQGPWDDASASIAEALVF